MDAAVDSARKVHIAAEGSRLKGILRRSANTAINGIAIALMTASLPLSGMDLHMLHDKQTAVTRQEMLTKIRRNVELRKDLQQTGMKLVYSVKNPNSEFFITIDDGWFPNEEVLNIMKEKHVPITSFLIKDAMVKHVGYWTRFLNLGGMIGNHTVSHQELDKLDFNGVLSQIDGSESAIYKLFNVRPEIFRPPCGAFDENVINCLKKEDMKYI